MPHSKRFFTIVVYDFHMSLYRWCHAISKIDNINFTLIMLILLLGTVLELCATSAGNT